MAWFLTWLVAAPYEDLRGEDGWGRREKSGGDGCREGNLKGRVFLRSERAGEV